MLPNNPSTPFCQGRGEGRLRRRRKYEARLREKHRHLKEQRTEQRAAVKACLPSSLYPHSIHAVAVDATVQCSALSFSGLLVLTISAGSRRKALVSKVPQQCDLFYSRLERRMVLTFSEQYGILDRWRH